MKTLIAFYSLTGNTKKLAEAIASVVGGEVLEIKTKKEIPAKGFVKYWMGGKQVMKKETPEIMPLDKNPNDYELIFLGTPVWAGNFAPAIKSFLKQAKLQNKKIALFAAHGGGPGKVFELLKKEIAAEGMGNEIIDENDFKMQYITSDQRKKNLEEAARWARDVIKK
jgi:flavodoxin